MTPGPYYADGTVTLYHGNSLEVLPELGACADLILTDPPYGETSLAWDRWPDGWPTLATLALRPGGSMWCFGSMRMFLDQRDEFAGWKFAQDVVWEKHNGSSLANDRFRRVHEFATQWYRGPWEDIHAADLRQSTGGRGRSIVRGKVPHLGSMGDEHWGETGTTRIARSVLRVASMHGRALHPTEKPTGILDPLIAYSCPPGGTVLDPFAGSGSTLDAARSSGRRAIGIEASEQYCEVIARRIEQGSLFAGDAA